MSVTDWETDTVFVCDWASEAGTVDLGVVETVRDRVKEGDTVGVMDLV